MVSLNIYINKVKISRMCKHLNYMRIDNNTNKNVNTNTLDYYF